LRHNFQATLLLHMHLKCAHLPPLMLQDGVPAAIQTLLDASIRVWMITGDKQVRRHTGRGHQQGRSVHDKAAYPASRTTACPFQAGNICWCAGRGWIVSFALQNIRTIYTRSFYFYQYFICRWHGC